MSKRPGIVFLFDVDNTLIDNDRVQAHLSEHLEQSYGATTRDRYWEIFEQLRSELGYADYLGALERYMHDPVHLAGDEVILPRVARLSAVRFSDDDDPGIGAKVFALHQAKVAKYPKWGQLVASIAVD